MRNAWGRAWSWWRRSREIRTLSDAWNLTVLPALYAGLFLGVGGAVVVWGRLMFDIPRDAPLNIRAIPYFVGILFMVYGIWLLRNNFNRMKDLGYLDAVRSHAQKLSKREHKQRAD